MGQVLSAQGIMGYLSTGIIRCENNMQIMAYIGIQVVFFMFF